MRRVLGTLAGTVRSGMARLSGEIFPQFRNQEVDRWHKSSQVNMNVHACVRAFYIVVSSKKLGKDPIPKMYNGYTKS